MADVSSKIFYYMGFIGLVTAAFIVAMFFVNMEAHYLLRLDGLEESVLVNRVVKCFSEEGSLGVVDEAKLDVDTLKGCFGGEENYGFAIKLIKKKASGGRPKFIEMGETGSLTEVNRYVLVETNKGLGPARLQIGYSKKR